MQADMPEPISFNPLKHHVGVIMKFVKDSDYHDLKILCESINHNNIDLYSGNLTVLEICERILHKLNNIGKFDKGQYETWIDFNGGFRYLKLDDESVWILLKGDINNRYIHIHPAKIGSHSIRFKGSTLKTIYQLMKKMDVVKGGISLELVNGVRGEMGLSPVKRLQSGRGILKCWEAFHVLY